MRLKRIFLFSFFRELGRTTGILVAIVLLIFLAKVLHLGEYISFPDEKKDIIILIGILILIFSR